MGTLHRPKRPKTQQWAGKVMASVFWHAVAILLIDYLEKDKTINSDYFMAILDRLTAKIKKKRSHMQKKKVDESFYKKGIEKLEKRRNECITLITDFKTNSAIYNTRSF